MCRRSWRSEHVTIAGPCECGAMQPTAVTVRPREQADLPLLTAALLAQQPETRYPFRDPMPVPVEDFLHAHDAVTAWTAELEGHPVGHVCRMAPARGFSAAALLNETCARAHHCNPSELAWVSTLFVAAEARGRGIGRRLMQVVVEDIRRDGRRPCLEVLPTHPAALFLYLRVGWRVVHRFRPRWLTEAAGRHGPDVHVMALIGTGTTPARGRRGTPAPGS